jgi:serine/threonine protein kinase
MSLTPGSRLGPHEIVALVGAGGMGEVYRARDTRLERIVAIKIATERLPERFQREARAVAALNHPNICQIYDVGPDYLVMEFVEGAPIRPVSSVAALLDLALQIADALVAAHDAGIVHRDLKPGNILLTPEGRVKLLDFGLARTTHGLTTDGTRTAVAPLTSPGSTMGTLAYMSPEQARGDQVDARGDLWSFGVVLYELATGERPFQGPTVAVTIDALLNKTPQSVRDRNPKVPAELERIISRLLEKDRETRYQSAADLRADLRRVERDSSGAHPAAADSTSGRQYRAALIVVAALAGLVALGAIWLASRTPPPPTSPSEYVQITDFNDSATAPSLSSDGRMVTFIRGGDPFLSQGQIYVKLLPNGDSRRLTSGADRKYAPVFAPDGSRIAYSTVLPSGRGSWDTWTVPVLGGEPTRLLPNASGLTWISEQRVLFSEITSGLHMGIVSALENRADTRTVYLPEHERAMAHFSYASPDRSRVLIVEMDRKQTWQRCRLTPMDGSSAGTPVGPDGACTSAGWSPDGRWMYFGVIVKGQSHLWRQRQGSGSAEQITFGPTEEQGVAVAPDGKSLVTSVGTSQSAIWLHDASGERQLSPEGFAGAPWVSADGRRAYYTLRQNPQSPGFELYMTELSSGKTDRVLPGVAILDFDVSRDERQVAFTTERNGESQIWLASLDRHSAPRQLAASADHVSFAGSAEIVFRFLGEHVNYLHRMRLDATTSEAITNLALLQKFTVSPDGEWATVSVVGNANEPMTLAVPVHGGAPRKLCDGRCAPRWSWDERFLYVSIGDPAARVSDVRQTIAIPVTPAQPLPASLLNGSDPKALADYPGAILVAQQGNLFPGLDPSTYVFAKADLRRNLFRIPLH